MIENASTCIDEFERLIATDLLTTAAVLGDPLLPYRTSTVELPSLADRYCHRAVATGEVSTKPPPFTRPSAVSAPRRPLGVTVGRSPKPGLLNQSDSATREPVGCWPLANVRELMQSGERL